MGGLGGGGGPEGRGRAGGGGDGVNWRTVRPPPRVSSRTHCGPPRTHSDAGPRHPVARAAVERPSRVATPRSPGPHRIPPSHWDCNYPRPVRCMSCPADLGAAPGLHLSVPCTLHVVGPPAPFPTSRRLATRRRTVWSCALGACPPPLFHIAEYATGERAWGARGETAAPRWSAAPSLGERPSPPATANVGGCAPAFPGPCRSNPPASGLRPVACKIRLVAVRPGTAHDASARRRPLVRGRPGTAQTRCPARRMRLCRLH